MLHFARDWTQRENLQLNEKIKRVTKDEALNQISLKQVQHRQIIPIQSVQAPNTIVFHTEPLSPFNALKRFYFLPADTTIKNIKQQSLIISGIRTESGEVNCINLII